MNKIENYLLMKKIMEEVCPTCAFYPNKCSALKKNKSFEQSILSEFRRQPLNEDEIFEKKLDCYTKKG